jgi:hypothetical protein
MARISQSSSLGEFRSTHHPCPHNFLRSFLWTGQDPQIYTLSGAVPRFGGQPRHSRPASGSRLVLCSGVPFDLSSGIFLFAVPEPDHRTVSFSSVETLRRALVCTLPLSGPPSTISGRRHSQGLTAPPSLTLLGAAPSLRFGTLLTLTESGHCYSFPRQPVHSREPLFLFSAPGPVTGRLIFPS